MQVVRVALNALKNLLLTPGLDVGPIMVEAGLQKVVAQRKLQVSTPALPVGCGTLCFVSTAEWQTHCEIGRNVVFASPSSPLKTLSQASQTIKERKVFRRNEPLRVYQSSNCDGESALRWIFSTSALLSIEQVCWINW